MKAVLITAAVVVVAVVTAGVLNVVGVYALHSGDGTRIAARVAAEVSGKVGSTVHVTCPARIPEKRGGIEDCEATAGHGTTVIRLTQDDSYGHFHYVVSDPTVLAPSDPTPGTAAGSSSAETDFGQACIGFGAQAGQCSCLYGQLAAHRTDSDVRRAAESYRRGDGLPEDLAFAGDACRRGA